MAEQRIIPKPEIKPAACSTSTLCSADYEDGGRLSPKRRRCYNLLRYAVGAGKLIKPKRCPMCNRDNIRICGHHKNYDKPLEVEWRCTRCHLRQHRGINWNAETRTKPPSLRLAEKRASIQIKGKRVYLPTLKNEPSQLCGLFYENTILDEHYYFEENYDWSEILKALSYRECEIIKLRYGLVDNYTHTLEEVGRIYKVTREFVRQVEKRAITKLQRILI